MKKKVKIDIMYTKMHTQVWNLSSQAIESESSKDFIKATHSGLPNSTT